MRHLVNEAIKKINSAIDCCESLSAFFNEARQRSESKAKWTQAKNAGDMEENLNRVIDSLRDNRNLVDEMFSGE